MQYNKSVYEPREDSTLLEKYVRQYAKGSVLDIGTGSGIQALTAAHNNKVKSVIALDIQKSAIEYCIKNIKNNKITFLISDLFQIFKKNKNLKSSKNSKNFLGSSKISKIFGKREIPDFQVHKKTQNDFFVNKKFDTIIFNPPYLPGEVKVKDLTIEGGKKGYEILERFLNEVNDFLNLNGIILIVFSSLTKKEKVNEFIEKNLLEFKLLEKQHYFFEDLYVYLIKKSLLLKKLEKNKINNLRYFKKGKRGLIFIGNYKDKKVAIKIKNPKSKAIARIENEIKFLKILNKKNIGPKLLFYDKDFLAYKYIDGISIIDYFDSTKNNRKNLLKIIINIFKQLYIMDNLQINKEEMSHPSKHIIIDKKYKSVLIDFERSRYTLRPSNVTQFCDFLMSKRILSLLKNNKIKINKKNIIELAKKYKKQINKSNLNKILKEIN